MASGQVNDLERLNEFLIKADLTHFYHQLQVYGVCKVEHLTDMENEDFERLGMSPLERKRLIRHLEKETKPGRLASLSVHLKQFSRKKRADTMPVIHTTRPASHNISSTPWSLSGDCIQIGRVIEGIVGEVGCVCEGDLKNDLGSSVPVAIRAAPNNVLFHRLVAKEAAKLYSLSHEHVIRFFGVVSINADEHCLVVMERCARGRLSVELTRYGQNYSLERAFQLSGQVASAMTYLEARGIVHGDLRAASVYLITPDQCKVSEFGLLRVAALSHGNKFEVSVQSDGVVRGKISYQWAAPEVFNTEVPTHKSDVWSFGSLLWEMFSHGETPWVNYNGMLILQEIDMPKKNRLARPCHCPPDIYALMHKCWSHDPADRPQFAALESLLEECRLQKAVVVSEETIIGNESMLTLRPSETITVIEKGHEICWFGQNSDNEYGEFRSDSVRLIKETKPDTPTRRKKPRPTPPGISQEASAIGKPTDFTHNFHIDASSTLDEDQLKRMIAHITEKNKEVGSVPPDVRTSPVAASSSAGKSARSVPVSPIAAPRHHTVNKCTSSSDVRKLATQSPSANPVIIPGGYGLHRRSYTHSGLQEFSTSSSPVPTRQVTYVRPTMPLPSQDKRVPPIGQEASSASQSAPPLSIFDEENPDRNAADEDEDFIGGEDEYMAMEGPNSKEDKPSSEEQTTSSDSENEPEDDYTDMSQVAEMRKSSSKSPSSRRSSGALLNGFGIEQEAHRVSSVSSEGTRSPEQQDKLTALKTDLESFPRRKPGRDSLGKLVKRNTSESSTDTLSDITPSSESPFYVNIGNKPPGPPPIPAKRKNGRAETSAVRLSTTSQRESLHRHYENIHRLPQTDMLPRSGSDPSVATGNGCGRVDSSVYSGLSADDLKCTDSRRLSASHNDLQLKVDSQRALYNRLQWHRDSEEDFGPDTPPPMLVDYSSQMPRPVSIDVAAEGDGYSRLHSGTSAAAVKPAPQKPPRRQYVMEQHADDSESDDEGPTYSMLESPRSENRPPSGQSQNRYVEIPERNSCEGEGGYAAPKRSPARLPPEGHCSPSSSPKVQKRSSTMSKPAIVPVAASEGSPFAAASKINERLPDLKLADIVVALNEYENPVVTERHLRAQLVLDIFNHMRDMKLEQPLENCEKAMKMSQWRRDKAVEYLLSQSPLMHHC